MPDNISTNDPLNSINPVSSHQEQRQEQQERHKRQERPFLSVQDLCVTLQGRKVLDHLNLDLYHQESRVILGCSGTGKSVLLKSILGLLPIQSGKIFIEGTNIVELSEKDRKESLKCIGMLFQGSALFDSLSVWENVAFGLIYGHQMPVTKARNIALEKLSLVDLGAETADLYPASLSGGMQKRVGLARALALNPQIIFFDEPTTGLDPITSHIVDQLISKTVKDSHVSALTITHDLQCLRSVADSISFLAGGKIVWTGSNTELDTTDNPYIHQFLNASPDGPCRVI